MKKKINQKEINETVHVIEDLIVVEAIKIETFTDDELGIPNVLSDTESTADEKDEDDRSIDMEDTPWCETEEFQLDNRDESDSAGQPVYSSEDTNSGQGLALVQLAENSSEKPINDWKEAIEKVVCHVCGRPFKRRSNLRDHMKTHTPIEERRKERSLIEEDDKPKALKCYLCELTFRIRKTLRDHMKLVHGANKHECPVCKKPIAGWYLIKRHLRTHQPIHERQQRTTAVNCDICQKPFRDRAALGNHVIYVHGPRNHECEICGFRFPLRSSLRKHMNTHDPDPHKRRRPSEQTTKSKRKKRVVVERNETSGTSRSFNKRQTLKNIKQAKDIKRQKKNKPRFHSCPLCTAQFATVVEFNKHLKQKHEEVLMEKAVEQELKIPQCMEHTESKEDVTFLFEAEEFKIEPE